MATQQKRGADRRQVITTLGLGEDVLCMLERCGLDAEVESWDCATDVIAHYSDLAIIDPAGLSGGEIDELAGFWEDIDPCDTKVLVLGKCCELERISFIRFAERGVLDSQESFSIAVVAALKESKRDVDFSRRIMHAVMLLHLISMQPGITTAKLAKRLELSQRSVKRYIRSLQATGMMIEYRDRGWHCLMDPRELF